MKKLPNPYGPSLCIMNVCDCTAEQHARARARGHNILDPTPCTRKVRMWPMLLLPLFVILCFCADMCQRSVRNECYRHLKAMYDKAARDASNAAFGGEHHDNGARALVRRLNTFIYGWHREIPDDWKGSMREDPEWAEYQRLKEKFDEPQG